MTLRKVDTNNVAALLEHKDGIKLVCANDNKRRCYLILAGLMVDYKEQVLITDIKANMQYSIYHVPPKERKLLTWLSEPRIYQSS